MMNFSVLLNLATGIFLLAGLSLAMLCAGAAFFMNRFLFHRLKPSDDYTRISGDCGKGRQGFQPVL
jgi:hypothetical protein